MTVINDGHTLHVHELQDYGHVQFRIVCPGPAECKATEEILGDEIEAPETPPPCYLSYWYNDDPDVGTESIMGRAAGPGPWDFTWEYKGDGDIDFYVGTAIIEHTLNSSKSKETS